MNSTATDAADGNSRASRDATAGWRKRSGNSRDSAMRELRAFLADVEELLRKVADISDAEVARARMRVADALADMRNTLGDTADSLRARARVAVHATDEYVREQPWAAIGIAAALGVLLGAGMSAATRGRR